MFGASCLDEAYCKIFRIEKEKNENLLHYVFHVPSTLIIDSSKRHSCIHQKAFLQAKKKGIIVWAIIKQNLEASIFRFNAILVVFIILVL